MYCRNCTSYENFKLKLCTSAQNHALGTCTKFQLEILTINVISDILYFHEIVLESLRNVSETTPSWPSEHRCHSKTTKMGSLFLSHFLSKYSYIVLRYWPQKSRYVTWSHCYLIDWIGWHDSWLQHSKYTYKSQECATLASMGKCGTRIIAHLRAIFFLVLLGDHRAMTSLSLGWK